VTATNLIPFGQDLPYPLEGQARRLSESAVGTSRLRRCADLPVEGFAPFRSIISRLPGAVGQDSDALKPRLHLGLLSERLGVEVIGQGGVCAPQGGQTALEDAGEERLRSEVEPLPSPLFNLALDLGHQSCVLLQHDSSLSRSLDDGSGFVKGTRQ
jgi:hypothetical protein